MTDQELQETMTQDQALLALKTERWKGRSYADIAKIQANQSRTICPFQVFHEAFEKHLGRPVFTRLNAHNRTPISRLVIFKEIDRFSNDPLKVEVTP